jgi:hypothetical protein
MSEMYQQPNVMEQQTQFAFTAPEGHEWMSQLDVQVGKTAVNAVVYLAMSNALDARRDTMEERGLDIANAVVQQALFSDEAPSDGQIAWAVGILNKDEQKRADYIEANYAQFAAQMMYEQQLRTQEELAHSSEDDVEEVVLSSGRVIRRKKSSSVLYPAFGSKCEDDASVVRQTQDKLSA